jgi:cytochrome c-type biogenesis protein CcmH/NrfG
MEIKIMKKISIVLILCFALLANCQKKEEQPVQTPLPSGIIQMNQEMQILQDVVKQDPANVGAWIKLGNLHMDSSRYHEAINGLTGQLRNSERLSPQTLFIPMLTEISVLYSHST